MVEYRWILKNPIALGLLAGAVMGLLAYVDNKMNDEPRDNRFYFKAFGATAILVTLLAYYLINGLPGLGVQSGGSDSVQQSVRQAVRTNTNFNRVMASVPDF